MGAHSANFKILVKKRECLGIAFVKTTSGGAKNLEFGGAELYILSR